MTNLAEATSAEFVKLIYIGDSGTGKTGSLTSLVNAGYQLKILDLDANVAPLKTYVLQECPEKIINVDVETRRDKVRSTLAGPMVNSPKAFTESLALMTKWSDGSIPAEWGKNTIFVLDSLSAYGRAAFQWARGFYPEAGGKKDLKDNRQWYFMAQQAVEDTVSLLTNPDFRCHVIVISHINWREISIDGDDKNTERKGFVNSIGSALNPILPRYFPTLVSTDKTGVGKYVKRVIRTLPTNELDLKTANPFSIAETLPLPTGLATLFEQLKSPSLNTKD